MWGISLPTEELLASQKELYSVYFAKVRGSYNEFIAINTVRNN
jgi:hypothetical protein